MSIPCFKFTFVKHFEVSKFNSIKCYVREKTKGQMDSPFCHIPIFQLNKIFLKMNVLSKHLNSFLNRKCEILQNERLASDIIY